jgi:predicted RNA-binding protein with RPS1 domain
MNSKLFIAQISDGFEQAIDEVINAVDGVNHQLMNIPEGEKKWSMLQFIKHTSIATAVYVKNLSELLENENQKPAVKEYSGGWMGRYLEKSNQPKQNGELKNKLKTFKWMDPENQLDQNEVIDEFIVTHQKMIELIKQSEVVNLDRTKIKTAVPMLKLRLGDAYKFLLAHTRRHVVQLRRIKSTVTTGLAD